MERRFRKSPVSKEFAPGIVDRDVFANMVEQNELFVSGEYLTEQGRDRMNIRLRQLNGLLNTRTLSKPWDRRHKTQRHQLLTEQAILEVLYFKSIHTLDFIP